jgi:hypothetical protein
LPAGKLNEKLTIFVYSRLQNTAIVHHDELGVFTMTTIVADNALSGKVLMRVRIIWFATVGIALILCVLTLPDYLQSVVDVVNLPLNGPGLAVPTTGTDLFLIAHFMYVLVFLAIGIMIFLRLPRDKMGLFTSAVFITLALSASSPLMPETNPLTFKIALIVSLVPVLGQALVYLSLPDGRIPHWSVTVPILVGFLFLNSIGPLILHSDLTRWASLVLWLALLTFELYRYRSTHALLPRKQIRWVAFGMCIIVLANFLRLPVVETTWVNWLGSSGVSFDTWMFIHEFIPFPLLSLAGPICIAISLLVIPRQVSVSKDVEDDPEASNLAHL